MNILFDTNVVLDVLLDRKPFSAPASVIFSLVEAGEFIGFLGATTVTTIFYLATKVVGKKQAEEEISKLLSIFAIAPVNRAVLEAAINSKFTDFEDAVLYESARHASAQAIVTRDAVGFKYAKISVYSPEELVKMTQAIKIIGTK